MRFTLWNTGGDPKEFFSVAAAAQEAGWSAMCLNEGTFQPIQQEDENYPFSADGRRSWEVTTPYLEPMTLLPALGAQFTDLRFLTWVLKLPLREPLTFAKQVATAAILLDNRLDLGVGMSWMPQEYQYTGIDWDSRRQRFLEMIEVLRAVLTGEVVEYHGKVFDFGPLVERPVPPEPVKFMIGGHKPASLRMAAKVGDGWCGVVAPTDELARILASIDELLEENDRDRAAFTTHAGALEARTVDDFAHLAELGLTDCIVMPWMRQLRDAGNDALEVPLGRRIELIHEFGENVIAPLRSLERRKG